MFKLTQTTLEIFITRCLCIVDKHKYLLFNNLILFGLYCRKEHEKCEFEVHEVYAVDVIVSSGEGKVTIKERNIMYVVFAVAKLCQ